MPTGSPAGILFVANLDFEVRLARGTGPAGAGLSAPAVRAVSALGTLLRAAAEEGDRLLLLSEVDPARMARVPGLAEPELGVRTAEPPGPAAALLPWGETAEVAALRALRTSGEPPDRSGLCGKWLRAGFPAPAAAAQANHRRFALDAARSLGLDLPGRELLLSLWALERHLMAGGAATAPGERWVLKAPLSAAGRERLFGRGRHIGERDLIRARALMDTQDSLLFEPWMERTADWSTTGFVTARGPTDLEVHRQHVDDRGRFSGITLGPPAAPLRDTLLAAAAGVGTLLVDLGYRGPFGVDQWEYLDAHGTPGLNAVGEVNARMTFGIVARMVAERVRPRLGPGEGDSLTLRVGREPPPASPRDRILPLLHPAPPDGTGAWLEIREN